MNMMTGLTASVRVNGPVRNLGSERCASGLLAESSRRTSVDGKTFQFGGGSTVVIVAAVIATGVIRYEHS